MGSVKRLRSPISRADLADAAKAALPELAESDNPLDSPKPAAGTSHRAQSPSSKRLKPTGVRKFIYTFGGATDDAPWNQGRLEYASAVERYDIEVDRWESMSPLPHRCEPCAIAQHGKHVYVFGGEVVTWSDFWLESDQKWHKHADDNVLNFVARCNLETNVWEDLGPLLPQCTKSERPEEAFAFGDYIFVASSSSISSFNPADQTWQLLYSIPLFHGLFRMRAWKMLECNGLLCVIPFAREVPGILFLPGTRERMQVAPLRSQRCVEAAQHGEVIATRHGLAIVDTNSSSLGSVWTCTLQLGGRWVRRPRCEYPRRLATVVALQDYLYVIGGFETYDDGTEDEVNVVERLSLCSEEAVWESVAPPKLFPGGAVPVVLQDLDSMVLVGSSMDEEDAHSQQKYVQRLSGCMSEPGRSKWQTCAPMPTPRCPKALLVQFPCRP
eukprot:TRINITY_DN53117_c0_g1_i1.p1 TRINITY_DN53117_c0_g1~~TRINITY_DN53117_c0_g1_i1.p1  ORF type:complete len:441 (-),score=67.06 TRINITY_DN53117_c0_g1_i1:213-1535(-)